MGKEATHLWRARVSTNQTKENPHLSESSTKHRPITQLALLLNQARRCNNLFQGKIAHDIILQCGFDRDTFLVNCLIQMYGDCGYIHDAQCMFDHGSLHVNNVYSWNLLINAYTQNGCLESALSIFTKMPVWDVVSWNTIIRGYAQNGKNKEALGLFHSMSANGFNPNNITFVCVLDACVKLCDLKEGMLIHNIIAQESCERDSIVGTTLVTFYGKCKNLNCAWRAFTKISHHNVITWTAMIGAMSQNSHPKEALSLFYKMRAKGINPNNVTFVCALDACMHLIEGQRIHSAIVCSGLEQDVIVGTNLIHMYTKCGCLQSGFHVFYTMDHKNVVTLNAMMKALNMSEEISKSLPLLYQSVRRDIKPDNTTFVCALEACGKNAHLKDGHTIHTAIIENQSEQDLIVANALIDMYTKFSSPNDARVVFRKMQCRDVISWTSLFSSYMHTHNHVDEVLKLLHEMYAKNIKPDNVTFACALDACCKFATLTDGQCIYTAVIDSGYEIDTVVGNTLVNLYGKCGCLHDAIHVFTKLKSRNVVTWTTMITTYALNGFPSKCVECFHHMHNENVKPNEITFTSALNACSHSGYLNNAWYFFSGINQSQTILYTRNHYACMINLLARAGHLNEAEYLINKAPFSNISVAWLSLLSACKIHGDEQRGFTVASQCFQADPQNTAPYIILSNM